MNVLTNLAQRRGIVAAAVVGLLALAVYVVWQLDPWAEPAGTCPPAFNWTCNSSSRWIRA